MKKQTKILMIILAIVMVSGAVIFLINKPIMGNAIIESDIDNYSYTKAICNSSNFCQDYKITCENNQTESIIPLTGAVVQFGDNWEDPRNKEDRERLC